MKYNHVNCFIILLGIFAVSCANIVTPTGGLKDVVAPKVVGTEPKMNATGFAGKSFQIDFDEFIKLNDAYNQVVISPYMKEMPDLKIRGKSLIVKIEDTLNQNTTYSISFGNAISDITENNILKDYHYAFSTGNTVDSLIIRGTVVNAYSLKPEAGVYVMLYKTFADSVPLIQKPFYLSKTDDAGTFTLKNLKNQSYKIFALRDADADLQFGMPNEEIAFIDTLVNPEVKDTSKVDSVLNLTALRLSLFKELPLTQKLLKSSSSGFGKALFVFRKPVGELTLKLLDNSTAHENFLREFSKNKDTLTLWLKNYEKDSLNMIITDIGFPADTVYMAMIKKSVDKSRGKGEEAAKIVKLSTNTTSSTFDFFKTFNIQASAPIEKNDFSKIVLVEGKDTVNAKFNYTDSIHRNLSMIYKWKEDMAYKLNIMPSAFVDIFGNPNDTIIQSFKTTKAEDYSKITVQFSTGAAKCIYLVQLLNDKDNLLSQQSTEMSASIEFENVAPGTYKVRVICDANANGEWDTGNYMKKIQPERVFYYPSTLTVRANWDQQIEWNIQPK